MAQTYVVCEKCGQTNRAQTNSEQKPVCGACKAELPIHDAIIEGSQHSLLKLIQKSPLPVVIDVWAPWCGPCRSFTPTFQSSSQKYAGKIVFVKLNSDSYPQMSNQLGVRGIPTLILFKNGQEIGRQSGALPKDHFERWLEQTVL